MIRDVVCGMEIDPDSAFATRNHAGKEFYFCSENCVNQFDQNPHKYTSNDQEQPALAGSITTGFNPALTLRQVVLPIIGLQKDGQPGAELIKKVLERQVGVEKLVVNPKEAVAVIDYDPQATNVLNLVNAIKKSGYRVGGAQTRIGIENLRCASCVRFIEDELKSTPGVLNANINVGTQEATIEYLPEQTVLSQLNTAIQHWGYQTREAASELPAGQQENAHEKEYRNLMSKFWFAAIISIPVLLTAYPKFIPVIQNWSMETLRIAWIAAAVLTLPVLIYSGGHFFTGAWAALRHRSANMNTLIALGTGAAWLYSTIAISFPAIFPEGTSEPFYDVVAVVS